MILIAILVFFLCIFEDSSDLILKELRNTDYTIMFQLIPLMVLFEILGALNMKWTAEQYHKKMILSDNVLFLFSASFYSFITFGGGTWIYYLTYFKKHDLDVSETVGINVYLYVMDKIAILMAANIALIYGYSVFYSLLGNVFFLILAAHILTLLMVGVILSLCLSEKIHRNVMTFLRKVIRKENFQQYLDTLEHELADLGKEMPFLLHSRTITCKVFGLSVLKHAALCIVPYFILCESMLMHWLDCMNLMALVNVFSGLIPLPGGLGSFDFGYLLFFVPYVGEVKAVSSLLLYRFPTFIVPILIGLGIVLIRWIHGLFAVNDQKG